MKVVVVIEVEVSTTMKDTMRRAGFSVAQDGTALKVVVPNSPSIPKRKTKVTFFENPTSIDGYVVSLPLKK